MELKSGKNRRYDPQINIQRRIIDLERRIARQEQYSRRECIEIVGLPENIKREELENAVIDTVHVAGVNVRK